MKPLSPSRLALLASVVFFLLLFVSFPLHSRLPGNTDSILAISLSNIILEKLTLFLSGGDPFTAFYPARDPLAYGENCYGLAGIFLIFKILTQSDHWGYYFFLVSLFSLNCFGMFKLASRFVGETATAWVAGLALSASGFVLSNIDDPNVLFLFLPLMALYSLDRGLSERDNRRVQTGFILAGTQIWFGFYVFAFFAAVLGLYFFFHWKAFRKIVKPGGAWRLWLGFFLPAVPLLAIYVYNANHADVIFPYNNPHSYQATSFGWNHFWNVLPNNLLYSSKANIYNPLDDSAWVRFRLNAFTGFLVPAFALIGLYVKRDLFLLSTFFIFALLSFGTHIFSFAFIERIPFGEYYRVPFRCWFVALMPLAVFFAVGLDHVLASAFPRKPQKRWKTWASLAIGAGVLLENVPFPLPSFDYAGLLYPNPEYVRFFSSSKKRNVILDLPSEYRCLAPDKIPVWSFSRDALYMNWQTYHRQVIAGGVNSYAPASRGQLDAVIKRLPANDALADLKRFEISHIVFHKKLILNPQEEVLPGLRSSPDLRLVSENDDLAIFEMKI